MRAFINLFLTLVLPISTISIVIAIIYYAMDFDITKALRLGTLTGVFAGIGFSLLMTSGLLLTRTIRAAVHRPQSKRKNNHASFQKTLSVANGPIDRQLMLLMDKELAFEVSLYAITDQHIGKISHEDRNKGSILIHTPKESISLAISPLTRHTSKMEIKANTDSKNVQRIITYLKAKERSFMDY